jgi:hypothetical protein
MRECLSPLNVEFVNALEIRQTHPVRILNGWELKPYAIIHSSFEELLLLDADNVPVENPEFLFETTEYRKTGAVFWPDYGRLAPTRRIWEICQVGYRDEPEFETGQIVVNKRRCWSALQLAMHYNEYSDFYYQYIHGDKETFHMAFRRLEQVYSMPERGIHKLRYTMCQHDFSGRRIFQHRNMAKWQLLTDNVRVSGFLFEEECRQYLTDLRKFWDGRSAEVRRFSKDGKTPRELNAAKCLCMGTFDYHRLNHDRRIMTFSDDGFVRIGAAEHEVFWDVYEFRGVLQLEIGSSSGPVCRFRESGDGNWMGKWLHFEKMPVELSLVKGALPQLGRKRYVRHS